MRGLPAVFDSSRRPWIEPEAAPAARVAEIVARCPTGALAAAWADGAPAEEPPGENDIAVGAAGPLYVCGDLRIYPEGVDEAVREMRAALCRCGASRTKPYCDGSHAGAGFDDPGAVAERPAGEPGAGSAPLEIRPAPAGPLLLAGPFELRGAAGELAWRGTKAALCRCGASRSKPFCDGSHKAIGFGGGDDGP